MKEIWHILSSNFIIGLLKEGTKEEVAQELKDGFAKGITEMSLESFISRCRCEQRGFLPELEMKTPPIHRQELIEPLPSEHNFPPLERLEGISKEETYMGESVGEGDDIFEDPLFDDEGCPRD